MTDRHDIVRAALLQNDMHFELPEQQIELAELERVRQKIIECEKQIVLERDSDADFAFSVDRNSLDPTVVNNAFAGRETDDGFIISVYIADVAAIVPPASECRPR